MSQLDDIKTNAKEIHRDLKRLAPDREVALPVHTSRELLSELETRAGRLVEQLEALESQQ